MYALIAEAARRGEGGRVTDERVREGGEPAQPARCGEEGGEEETGRQNTTDDLM